MYDRRQKKKNQKKWCDVVAHVAQQPLPVNQMARRITVFISAPPGDGIRPSREFFKEYVKPVLVAAAMDYDVIEGRKEGDVRFGAAEQIRRLRRKSGESNDKEGEEDSVKVLEDMRERMQITPEPAVRGDLVLGRHTWKEYVRGIHEGWLGPVNEPAEETSLAADLSPTSQDLPPVHNTGEATEEKPMTDGEAATEPEKPAEEKPAEEKKKPYPPPSFLLTSAYSTAALAPATPAVFEPSQPIHQYHLLGFLRTPIRIWNYLNQRTLADRIGRDTAALVLAASRPYESTSSGSFTPSDDASPALSADSETGSTSQGSEQAAVLGEEETTWHKSVRKAPKKDDGSERIWTADMVLDNRIASRMRKFELDFEEAARAERIGSGQEKGLAREVLDLRKEPVKMDLAYEDD